MSGMVTWRETNVPDQVFGKVGVIDLFIIGRDPELGTLVLGVKGLFGHDRGMIEFKPDQYDTLQDAQQAAEREVVRILADLDQVRRDLTGAA
jgi:hypothetical protein